MGMQCTFSFADLLATAGGVDLSYEFVEEAQGDTPDSRATHFCVREADQLRRRPDRGGRQPTLR